MGEICQATGAMALRAESRAAAEQNRDTGHAKGGNDAGRRSRRDGNTRDVVGTAGELRREAEGTRALGAKRRTGTGRDRESERASERQICHMRAQRARLRKAF
ncbi:hypothetical protein ERJ75_000632000 [Trypanosoma vivax]|nr:hypothetical protein ERJ75_000632000 [Trypanosoma vivax]